MKKLLFSILLLSSIFQSCSTVKSNYYGVLMKNYGKNGKSDYQKQQGTVWLLSPGTELYRVSAWEQRADFKDGENAKDFLRLKASDNTEFNAKPMYSYKAIPDKVIDLVFQNSRLGSGDEFMRALENNILEALIYDIIKEESRIYTTDTLMATGGSLKFEYVVENKVKKLLLKKV